MTPPHDIPLPHYILGSELPDLYEVRCQFADDTGTASVLMNVDCTAVRTVRPSDFFLSRALRRRIQDTVEANVLRYYDFATCYGTRRWSRKWPGLRDTQGLGLVEVTGLLVPICHTNGVPVPEAPPLLQYRLRIDIDTNDVSLGFHCQANPRGEYADTENVVQNMRAVTADFRGEILTFIEGLRLHRDSRLITLASQLEVK